MTNEISSNATPNSEEIKQHLFGAELIPAKKVLRFANFLIDYFSVMVLGMFVGLCVGLLFGQAGLNYLKSVPDILLSIPMVLTYYIAFEGIMGRTIGKLVTGTKVVNEKGTAPSFRQILGRSFSRLIPFEALTFLGKDSRGWHDSLPKTYVIKCRYSHY